MFGIKVVFFVRYIFSCVNLFCLFGDGGLASTWFITKSPVRVDVNGFSTFAPLSVAASKKYLKITNCCIAINLKKMPWLGYFGGNFLFFPDGLKPDAFEPDAFDPDDSNPND